jgi:hypothetical protein
MSLVISECETSEIGTFCGTWIWNGQYFDGSWVNGASAKLTVEQFDNDSVIINRQDVGGVSDGLVARYEGQRNGNQIKGKVTSQDQTWTWTATLSTSENVPAYIGALESNPYYNATKLTDAAPKNKTSNDLNGLGNHTLLTITGGFTDELTELLTNELFKEVTTLPKGYAAQGGVFKEGVEKLIKQIPAIEPI